VDPDPDSDPDPQQCKLDAAVYLGDGAGLVEPPGVAAITDGTHGRVGHGSTTANLITARGLITLY
jgi:hypothetical protein